MPIVGKIGLSGRRPLVLKSKIFKPIQYLIDRAWDIKRKIKGHLNNTKATCNATIKDRDEGSCLGPFWLEAEVSVALGCNDRILTQRFEVRGCDSATDNLVNVITGFCDKLQLPTADMNVAALRLS